MKRKIIIVLLTILLTLGGCAKNEYSSPENVAINMAERLSKGNYKNIQELIYSEGELFIDEESFKNYLSSNYLNIEGNEKIELVKEDSIDDKDITNKTIKIRIDNNKVLKVNTIKKDDKWYVDLRNKLDSNLIIKVPSGSKVKLNDKILDYKKYAETINDEKMLNKYKYTQTVDEYTIPYILEGKYNLVIENDELSTINEEIYSDKTDYNNKDNIFYTSKTSYSLLSKTNDSITKDLKDFLNKYYSDVINAGTESKDFSEIEKYFIKNTDIYDSVKKEYEEYKKGFIDNTYTTWTTYFSNVKADFSFDNNYYGGFYINKNNYIITGKVTLTYTMTTKYESGYYSSKEDEIKENKKEKLIVLDIIKNDDGSFSIKNGLNLFPEFSRY